MVQDLAICTLTQSESSKTTTTLVLSFLVRTHFGTGSTKETTLLVPQPRRKMV
jgi:hypothetical protein